MLREPLKSLLPVVEAVRDKSEARSAASTSGPKTAVFFHRDFVPESNFLEADLVHPCPRCATVLDRVSRTEVEKDEKRLPVKENCIYAKYGENKACFREKVSRRNTVLAR